METAKVLALQCAVQEYAWGRVGSDSEVANLSAMGNNEFHLNKNTTYAELWMGTHPKGPSVIASSGTSLSQWVADNADSVGAKVEKRFPAQGQLPFLFKVLSVNKALSLQAHPNKSHAEQLYSLRPDKYPDSNHKPEMAIALTEFEGLCGFRPRDEIVGFLHNVPEFKAVIGQSAAEQLVNSANEEAAKSSLQNCFTALMTCDENIVSEHLDSLVQRLSEQESRGENTASSLGPLLLRLHGQFPGDVGCFCIYFLNHMVLQPGEAMFLQANLPHAYLSGDCMECMACSDNVVRAGLTPKFKDISTLCHMLDYNGKPAKDNLFSSCPHPTDPHVTLYNPPIDDFTVAKIQLPAGMPSYILASVDSASIVLVLQGRASASNSTLGSDRLPLHRGSVIFVAAGQELKLTPDAPAQMLMFRAYCQL